MFTNHPSSFSLMRLYSQILETWRQAKMELPHMRIFLSIFLSEEDATKMHCSFVLCVLYLHSVNCAPTLALTVPAVLCSFPLLQRAGGGGLVFNFQFSTFQILSTRKLGSLISVNLFHQTKYSFQMKCQQCLKTFILMP